MYCDEARTPKRLFAANASDTTFPSRIATITEPTNDGVLAIGKNGQAVPSRIKLWPILLGNDGDSALMRVIGWERILGTQPGHSGSPTKTLWYPSVLAAFTLTAGTSVGVAGSMVLATERFCDTIVPIDTFQREYVDGGNAAMNSMIGVHSPVNNLIGSVIVAIEGCEKLEITWSDNAVGTPTKNVLYKLLP